MKNKLRNKLGSMSIMSDRCATDDNLAIALATYFEDLPECPKGDFNDELGWSQWAIDKTNNLLDRIVEQFLTTHTDDESACGREGGAVPFILRPFHYITANKP